jgi:hypothetical protein
VIWTMLKGIQRAARRGNLDRYSMVDEQGLLLGLSTDSPSAAKARPAGGDRRINVGLGSPRARVAVAGRERSGRRDRARRQRGELVCGRAAARTRSGSSQSRRPLFESVVYSTVV